MEYSDRLDECTDFSSVFNLIKEIVRMTINRGRAGLSLGMSELPMFIGAYFSVGSNFIVINKNLLKKVLATEDKRLTNAYIFHILLHEYIHSLGYLDEKITRQLTYAISAKVLGETHPATEMAKYGINHIFKHIGMVKHFQPEKVSGTIEIIEDFERENMNYFG